MFIHEINYNIQLRWRDECIMRDLQNYHKLFLISFHFATGVKFSHQGFQCIPIEKGYTNCLFEIAFAKHSLWTTSAKIFSHKKKNKCIYTFFSIGFLPCSFIKYFFHSHTHTFIAMLICPFCDAHIRV